MRLQNRFLADVHAELKEEYRKFFESKLAADLSKEKNYFFSVRKISESILKLIISNKSTVLEIIRKTPAIKKELQMPYYGSCFKADESPTSEEILATIIDTLTSKESELSKVMQIHCIFAYRIYDKLNIPTEKKTEKELLTSALVRNSLFSASHPEDRIERSAEPTKALGFAQHPVFAKLVGDDHTPHLRAVDRFQLKADNSFHINARNEKMPVICGPSGHTKSLLTGAKLYGELASIELSEYTFACFVFLAAGGNHSFHEVMSVANLFGHPYVQGEYDRSIPSTIKEMKTYTALSERFPEFVSPSFAL